MILTTLDDLARYACLGPNFAKAIEWARGADWAALTPGKHPIDGERLFLICETMTPRPLGPETVWEAHDRYADIQCLLEGAERMGWTPRTDDLPVRTPYDAATDKVFYDPEKIRGEWFDFRPGQVMFFFPEDAHAPCVAPESPAPVKRAVFKVRLD
ncbi:Toxin-antitoxin biofilm protein TabA [Botrimarina colliarenosi]|uniref:Toxin-antitoxin biofilm protein TabA n=1 Tax=Botrimarina colliarenosi TaxID=2528001 RepID=A0A5C6AJ65_9BACT|nr:YhcH/YjgK/YiaL family protein [Botrimarina colliarenosi]TWU00065.1 Toxin-antitoxin biofilm protein TabA [Botrimarina colliarenosi]